MKIGILTQPLLNNYGGLLQAYALQQVLLRRGHDVLTVDIPFRRTKIRDLKGIVYRTVQKFLYNKKEPVFVFRPTEEEAAIVARHTRQFVKDNIKTTERIRLVEHIGRLEKYNFDAYVVGSDQVWRPLYSPGITTFFLDFLEGDSKTKRLSYAASFGTDQWEFTEKDTRKCGRLAKQFDAISVREDSGVRLCKEKLGVSSVHLPDPTLLLDKNDYVTLIEKDNIPEKTNTMMLYVLDRTPEKDAIVKQVNKELSLTVNSVMPDKKLNKDTRSSVEDCVFPPVTAWLRGFMDAEFVITDSFHGTIFSIIFQKPFLAIANDARGVARFTSLLKVFGLEERLVRPGETFDLGALEPIDYSKVEPVLRQEQENAFKFLSDNGL